LSSNGKKPRFLFSISARKKQREAFERPPQAVAHPNIEQRRQTVAVLQTFPGAVRRSDHLFSFPDISPASAFDLIEQTLERVIFESSSNTLTLGASRRNVR